MITLADLTPYDWKELPEKPCVYVVHDKDRAIYVGQTKNVKRRWIMHHRSRYIKAHYPGATISLLEVSSEGERLGVERSLIEALNPTLNGYIGPGLLSLQTTHSVSDFTFWEWADRQRYTMTHIAKLLSYSPEYLSRMKFGVVPVTVDFVARCVLIFGEDTKRFFPGVLCETENPSTPAAS